MTSGLALLLLELLVLVLVLELPLLPQLLILLLRQMRERAKSAYGQETGMDLHGHCSVAAGRDRPLMRTAHRATAA